MTRWNGFDRVSSFREIQGRFAGWDRIRQPRGFQLVSDYLSWDGFFSSQPQEIGQRDLNQRGCDQFDQHQ